MPAGAITFDFHNTLVRCDPWFDLEVRSLPSAFLRFRVNQGGEQGLLDRAPAADRAYRALRAAIIDHGHELSAERCLAIVLAKIGVIASEDEIATGVETLMAETLPSSTLVEGAADTIADLAAAGVPLGVVSSAVYHPFLVWALERFGLRGHFAVIVTSAASGYYKSRPEIYWTTLSALACQPALSLHVGDSHRFDVLGARRAGMRTAWLTREPTNGHGADVRLATLQGAGPVLLAALNSTPA